MKVTKRQLRQIIREEKQKLTPTLMEKDSVAVNKAIDRINPEEMSKAELELLSMKLDDLIRQLSESNVKITKRQLLQIIKEERAVLAENRDELKDFKITMTVRVPAHAVEYVINSVEVGMEFDEEAGEGILNYSVDEISAPKFIDMTDPRKMR